MSYNSETSLINYVSKYIGYTFILKYKIKYYCQFRPAFIYKNDTDFFGKGDWMLTFLQIFLSSL